MINKIIRIVQDHTILVKLPQVSVSKLKVMTFGTEQHSDLVRKLKQLLEERPNGTET